MFPDLPWNSGLTTTVKYNLPERTITAAEYPVAVGNAVTTYMMMSASAAHACINRMLYAGGMTDYVTSGWRSFGAGLLYFFGPSQYGSPVAGAIIESPGCGCGSTTKRAGVDAGGSYIVTSANVPDAEAIEARAPFMYLTKHIAIDSGGAGKYRGGNGAAMLYMVHGTKGFQLGRRGCGKRIASSLGMFGGYPGATQPGVVIFNSSVEESFKQSEYPTTMHEVLKIKGDVIDDPPPSLQAREVGEGTLCMNTYAGGGGYGDPVEADPHEVAQDVRDQMVSRETAEKLYGVILDPDTLEIKWEETSLKRDEIRQERIREGRKVS
jgi:N-methylhydantoinase B